MQLPHFPNPVCHPHGVLQGPILVSENQPCLKTLTRHKMVRTKSQRPSLELPCTCSPAPAALHLQCSTVAAIADCFYFLQLSILVSVMKGPMRDSSVPLLHGLMSCFLISNTFHYTHLHWWTLPCVIYMQGCQNTEVLKSREGAEGEMNSYCVLPLCLLLRDL